MARVAVTTAQGDAKATPSEGKPKPSATRGGVVPARNGASGVVLEVGSVRILLGSSFDRTVLADVLAVVGAGSAR